MPALVIEKLLALALLQSPSTEQIFLSAAQALQKADYPTAESGFLQVLKREPSNIGALGNLGVLYSRTNRPTRAIEVYERALKLAPNQPGLLLNLGLAYLKLDDFARAKPLFARLAPLAGPRQAQARELLAITQLQTGEVAPAVAALESLAAQPQPTPATLQFLALGYLRQGQKEKAASVIAKLFDSLPPARANYLEGRIWYDSALFERALESFSKAAAADPKLPGLALEMGKTYISLRQASEAERQLRAAISEDPANSEAAYFLGALLVQNGSAAEGAALLAPIHAQRPDLWGTSYYLGKAQLALQQPLKAIPLLEQAARHSPKEAAVQYQLARALQLAGRTAEAKQAFARVQALQKAGAQEPLVLR